jgi:enoyl-CoA hydratase/carnithine racemase
VNPSFAHADLIATFKRAEADAAHKFGLIKVAAKKGPKAIQAAVDAATKAAKRRDSYAKKLDALGVSVKTDDAHAGQCAQYPCEQSDPGYPDA